MITHDFLSFVFGFLFVLMMVAVVAIVLYEIVNHWEAIVEFLNQAVNYTLGAVAIVFAVCLVLFFVLMAPVFWVYNRCARVYK